MFDEDSRGIDGLDYRLDLTPEELDRLETLKPANELAEQAQPPRVLRLVGIDRARPGERELAK